MTEVFKRFPFLITPAQYVVTLFLYLQCGIIMGVSLYPSLSFIYFYWIKTEEWSTSFGMFGRLFGLSLLVALGYFLYAIVLIFVVGTICFVFRLRIKEGKYYHDISLGDGVRRMVILSQIRLIDSKRLQEKVTMIDESQFLKIKQAVIRLME